MKLRYHLEEAAQYFQGAPPEKGGTSIKGKAAPGVRWLFNQGHINPGDRVLDWGAGAFARNANWLREQGCTVYAYDPFHGKKADGYSGVSKKIPPSGDRFDVGFSSFVLNVVPERKEKQILRWMSMFCRKHYHVTRNMDIFKMAKKALTRHDKMVGGFFLNVYAIDDTALAEKYLNKTLTDDDIMAFCIHGLATVKGFQRIPNLENEGYKLLRKTDGFKIYCVKK